MSRLPKHCNLISLNGKPIIVVFQTTPYAIMIQDDLMVEHFEKVFNVEMSAKTKELEYAYEAEYNWEINQIEYVESDGAIKRAHAAMKEAFPNEDEDDDE